MNKNIKKNIIQMIIFFVIILITILNKDIFAKEPGLVSKIYRAFYNIKVYIIKISTPAAAVAISSGLIMRKFSFSDEERIRTSKKIIRGSIFSYAFILCIDLILSLLETLLK